MNYPLLWRWNKWPRSSWNPKEDGGFKGMRCRVLCSSKGPGPKNALVEFENGVQVVVTRAAYRFAMRNAPEGAE